jgi:hypothetical protein
MELQDLEIKIKDVMSKRKELYILDSQGKITREKYLEEYQKLDTQYIDLTKQKIEILNQQTSIKIEQRTKMETESKQPTQRKVRTESQAAYIEKALSMKSIKSYEDVAEKVIEWLPGKDKKKVISQAKVIVKLVKSGQKARWKNYTWDEEAFLLTKTE